MEVGDEVVVDGHHRVGLPRSRGRWLPRLELFDLFHIGAQGRGRQALGLSEHHGSHTSGALIKLDRQVALKPQVGPVGPKK